MPILLDLTAAVAGTAGAPAPVASNDRADLIAADQRMQRAFVERDIATLRDILTDDYVLVVSSGDERTKAMVLAELASPEVHWEVNQSSGWVVRVHGDTAIVVATLHQKGVDHGKPFDSNVKFSDTWIRDHGKWRNVHAHASRAVDVGD
ncbi:nuclear transport factor 2 family protein [Dokdonella sp.]|uniref:nuclear transport factor 2 family protein n=1 Tax=Dokdonella sp. TaxID=2291710 RepID=UPI00378302D9